MPSAAYVRQASLARRRRFRRAGWPGISTQLQPVTFPTSPLTMRVHIALGADLNASHLSWNWLDVTEYVREDLGVSLTLGRRDEYGRVTASKAQLKLRNPDGIFVRLNPTGPYFGLLSRNTPIWIELNPGSGFVDRYYGYINELPTRWGDQSGSGSFVTITCAGVMRRLAQGEVLRSAVTRSTLGTTPGDYVPHAYWPMEDGAGASSFLPATLDTQPVLPSGSVAFASQSDLAGSDALPVFSGGASATFAVPGYTSTGVWALQLLVRAPSEPTPSTTIATVTTGGQGLIVRYELNLSPGPPSQMILRGYDSVGGVQTVAQILFDGSGPGNPLAADFYGNWWSVRVAEITSGSNVIAYLGLAATDGSGASVNGGSVAGSHSTIGAVTLSAASATDQIAFGHVAAFTDPAFSVSTDLTLNAAALSGWAGELAHERVSRLCREASIPAHVTAGTSAAMGPQGSGTLLDELRDCEAADGGVLYEHQFGIGYQALSERFNQPVALELDFDAGHIIMPAPADDDQRLRNEWTVARDGGSFATYRDDANVALNGLYDDQATVNVETDAQLADVAGWKVHVGTVDEYRWPGIPIKLHGSPDVIPAWLATPLGSRVTIDNPPAGLPPDQIDLVLEGYTERWDTVSWDVSLNTSPASAYRVGVYGTAPTVSRYDSANSALSAAVGTSDTSLTVATEAGHAPWITTASYASQFPFDIGIGGEQIAVTGIVSATSPQTFTVTRGVNGVSKSHDSGAQVRLWQPARYAL